MNLKEIAEKFPLGSIVTNKKDRWGIILGHRETVPGMARVRIAWAIDPHDTFEYDKATSPEDIEPFGEIEAVKVLIDFAGRLLQGEATLCCGEEDKLKEAIAICEGAFGI